MNSIERNRSTGLMKLRDPSNSYKCYESIPTPSPISTEMSKSNGDTLKNVTSQSAGGDASNLHRPASLDSLINSSEQETSEDDIDQLSDSDSLTELKNITGSSKQEDIPRKSDIEDLKKVEPPKEPVIKAYLEKSHKKCDYKNCGFKKSEQMNYDEIETIEEYVAKTTSLTNTMQPQPLQLPFPPLQPPDDEDTSPPNGKQPNGGMKNRRSNSSGSCGRMETIIEEPIEPKVSVKEILARFETLREAAEVKYDPSIFF